MSNRKPDNPVINGFKKCTKCSTVKSVNEYYLKNNKPRSNCKNCHALEAKPRYSQNKERYNNYSKKWYKENPEKVKNIFLRNRYNITLEDFNEMLKNQNNTCAICKKDKQGERDFHIDHCHTTGKVRGILCYKCNSSIGLLNDNIETLKEAIKYLEKHK